MQGSRRTDRIMQKISPHLLPGTDHYNRVYEIIEQSHREDNVTNAVSDLCIKTTCGDRGDWFCDPTCNRFQLKGDQ